MVFACQLKATSENLQNLAEKGVSNKSDFDKIVEEMRKVKYGEFKEVSDVLLYIDDKEAASKKSGATANTIRKEREVKAERLAKAERDQKAEIERKNNLPLTLSKLDLNVTYTYYKDNSCRNNKETQCLNINQYKQMCEWSDRQHEPFLRDLAASNMITSYTRNEKLEYYNFIGSAGSLERKSNLYSSDGTCRVNFSISGMWKGSNHVRSFTGVVQTFRVYDLGQGTGKRYVYVRHADGLY
jgi:hypothetical protein